MRMDNHDLLYWIKNQIDDMIENEYFDTNILQEICDEIINFLEEYDENEYDENEDEDY